MHVYLLEFPMSISINSLAAFDPYTRLIVYFIQNQLQKSTSNLFQYKFTLPFVQILFSAANTLQFRKSL